MWKRSFGARLPSKGESGRCEHEAFVRDFLQILKVQVVKMTPELAVPLRGRSENDPTRTERVSQPSAGQASPSIFRDTFCLANHSILCIRCLSKTHFVRDFPEKLKAEDVKTKLSCETSFKIWKWKMWKRSFRARLPSKSESGRCGNEAFVRDCPHEIWSGRCRNKAFVRDFLQNLKLEVFVPCHVIPFHSNPFQSIPVQSIPFQSIPFQSIPFHSSPFNFICSWPS